MVTSIILMNVERTQINDAADQIASFEGVSEVYSVSGNYDLVAIVRVNTNDDLADLVTKEMHKVTSITKTETMLAFRAISRYDLEAAFSIGFMDQ